MAASSPIKAGFVRVDVNAATVWEVPERYQNLTYAGARSYGQVCITVDTQRNVKVAIKKLEKPFHSIIHAKRTYREVCMLKHMDHENVIGLLDIFTPNMTLEDFQDVYLVTPFAGDYLNDIIRSQRLSEDHVQLFIYQILRGLKYVHSAGIIHRDLKPSSIAFNIKDNKLKILDFGLARQTNDEMTGYGETRWYRAPEIMLNWMHYDNSVDIWSVGCIMAELMTGRTLFPGTDHLDQLRKIIELLGTPSQEFLSKIISDTARRFIESLPPVQKQDFTYVFPGANPEVIDLLEKMFDLDPERRITAEEALAHPYLAQYSTATDDATSELYDHSFEDKELDISGWKKLVYDEEVNFVPPGTD